MRKKKTEEFKSKHAKNAWGESINAASGSLLEGSLPGTITEGETLAVPETPAT